MKEKSPDCFQDQKRIAERDPKFEGFIVSPDQILTKLAKSWKNQFKADIVKEQRALAREGQVTAKKRGGRRPNLKGRSVECLYRLERFVPNKFPVIENPSEELQRTLTLCFNSTGYWLKKCPSLFRNDLLEMDKVLEKLFTGTGEQGDLVKPYSSWAICQPVCENWIIGWCNENLHKQPDRWV